MNKKTSLLVFWTGALLFSTLACGTATSLSDRSSSPAVSATAESRTLDPAVSASCGSLLNQIVSAATTAGSYAEPEQERHLVTYKVDGEEITDPQFEAIPADLQNVQQDLATQHRTWDYFTALIPQEERAMVSTYSVITDGDANLLSAVAQTPADPTHWALEVDIADSADYNNLTFTLIHEFGHLLTLNADQVPPSQGIFSRSEAGKVHDLEVSLCPNYFPGEGCSRPDSYINQFYQRFWVNIYGEWNEIDQIEDDGVYYEKLNQFHSKYQDQFVTDYAATNPGEDIAESWAYFVLTPKPDGDTIAEQKVLFFHKYPALVELRANVLSRLCTSFPSPYGTE